MVQWQQHHLTIAGRYNPISRWSFDHSIGFASVAVAAAAADGDDGGGDGENDDGDDGGGHRIVCYRICHTPAPTNSFDPQSHHCYRCLLAVQCRRGFYRPCMGYHCVLFFVDSTHTTHVWHTHWSHFAEMACAAVEVAVAVVYAADVSVTVTAASPITYDDALLAMLSMR